MALFLATIGLFIATGALGYFAFRQMRDMETSIAATQKSADAAAAAADAAVASERATVYVVFVEDNFTKFIRTAEAWINTASVNEEPVSDEPFVKINFKNYGKTPAIIKEASLFIACRSAPPDPVYSALVTKEDMIASGEATENAVVKMPPITFERPKVSTLAVHIFGFAVGLIMKMSLENPTYIGLCADGGDW